MKNKPVAIVMGSDSDYPVMKAALEALEKLGVSAECSVLSAHRTPEEVADFARGARAQGVQVIIAGAGGAAHLPGMIAAYTELPVIGVPVALPPLQGQDSLLSIVQMPRGVPVATVSIGGAWNAGVLAAQMIGTNKTLDAVREYKDALRREVRGKKLPKT